ncbi:DinB family protein [Pseudonocardia pini]|uniref:DinB family protein n=1 Tax=Pseudonocardia pini TaxID=2758030 RepID=UPI0028AEFDD0|nr:DinB family protein [Pseudonocardia pini]
MTEVSGGSRSELSVTDVSLTDARFSEIQVTRASFWRVRVRGAWIGEVEIDGAVEGLRINGVDVGPLVEAELDRRHPDRARMRPTDPAGFREAWEVLESLWAGTVERARALPPDLLHERVDGEWSFVQTLRHLLYATDVWVSRVMLGDPTPWHPLSLPFDEMPPDPAVPWDLAARPDLDAVLALRAERRATVRRVLEGLTEESLEGRTEPVDGPAWPPPDRYPVAECLLTVLNEEWQHRLYAERDLDVLAARRGTAHHGTVRPR